MHESLRSVLESLDDALRGRPHVTRLSAAVFLAGGHLLLEDVPGVGKTTLAKALAGAVGGTMGRVQFTPDLMPSDLTGVMVLESLRQEFVFHPGPIFATVVVADEINRASPKTQSALLEAMAEGHVTVDGTTHDLPRPFMVIATQNPYEMAGTYPLPEAQRDRFMARTHIGYPDPDQELQVLISGGWVSSASAVLPLEQIRGLMEAIGGLYVSERVYGYILDILRRTRDHPHVRLGASPRAGLHVVSLVRAWALLDGRDHVLPDDVQAVAGPALAHRLVMSKDATLQGVAPEDVLHEILTSTPVP